MGQIAQLKYYMKFDMFEIANMTAEDRQFYIRWHNKIKEQENKQTQSNQTPSNDTQFGPATN